MDERIPSRVSAIILNWNRAAETIKAAASVRASGYPVHRIVIVDNGSNPVELSLLESASEEYVVISLASNHGFARAVNIGASNAILDGARYLLLLNNDAFFQENDGTIAGLVDALVQDPRLAAAGPCIVNDDGNRTVQSCGLRYSAVLPIPFAPGRGKRADTAGSNARSTNFLSGACMLVDAEAFVAVGGFDPDFFFLGEDIDLMLRFKRLGLSERALPNLFVTHKKSLSIKEGSRRYAYTAIRSNLILLEKHAKGIRRILGTISMIAISFALIFRSSTSWKGAGVTAVVRAWLDYHAGRWGGFDGAWPSGYDHPNLLRGRCGNQEHRAAD